MKKLFYVLAVVLLAITACQKEENASDNEYVEMSIGLGGEFSQSFSPLTKAGEQTVDIIAFNVYSRPEGSNESYERYAYGSFESTSDISVRLMKGYQYKIDAVSVKDCQSSKLNSGYVLLKNLHGGSTGVYTDYAKVPTNEFIFSTFYSYQFRGRDEQIDIYAGRTIDITPQNDQAININMERLVYGFRLKAENLTEGKIAVHGLTVEAPETQAEGIFAFTYPLSHLGENDGLSTTEFTVYWTKSDGAEVPLGKTSLHFKKNQMTTLTVKVGDQGVDGGIGLTYEDETPIVDGESFTVGDNGSVDSDIETN
ncbi:MAG: hypothetical protein MJY72_06030 [Bacteroidales bacterium]|nr:hypothetical protein [Bacteroidales bacterium]